MKKKSSKTIESMMTYPSVPDPKSNTYSELDTKWDLLDDHTLHIFEEEQAQDQDHLILDTIDMLETQSPSNDQHPSVEQHPSAQEEKPIFSKDRYRLIELIGEGGMGKVYHTYDHHLNRMVALKMLKRPIFGEASLIFEREAKLLANLTHPGIVPLYDLFHEGEDTYFTMEMISGETLSWHIHHHHNTLEDASERLYTLLTQLLKSSEAIGYAHEQGVIHRDLKPQNIMIGAHGEVKVLDWGLGHVNSSLHEEHLNTETLVTSPENIDQNQTPNSSRDSSHDSSRNSARNSSRDSAEIKPFTLMGHLSGTPAYMSPEQARLEVLDVRSDVYSLGAILYQILSGTPPYVGDALKIVERILQGERPLALIDLLNQQRADSRFHSPSLTNLSSSTQSKTSSHYLSPHLRYITPALIQLCEKAMHIQKDERHNNAVEFAEELRLILSGVARKKEAYDLLNQAKQLFAQLNINHLLCISNHQKALDQSKVKSLNINPLLPHNITQISSTSTWDRLKVIQNIKMMINKISHIQQILELAYSKSPIEPEIILLSITSQYLYFLNIYHTSPRAPMCHILKQQVNLWIQRLAELPDDALKELDFLNRDNSFYDQLQREIELLKCEQRAVTFKINQELKTGELLSCTLMSSPPKPDLHVDMSDQTVHNSDSDGYTFLLGEGETKSHNVCLPWGCYLIELQFKSQGEVNQYVVPFDVSPPFTSAIFDYLASLLNLKNLDVSHFFPEINLNTNHSSQQSNTSRLEVLLSLPLTRLDSKVFTPYLIDPHMVWISAGRSRYGSNMPITGSLPFTSESLPAYYMKCTHVTFKDYKLFLYDIYETYGVVELNLLTPIHDFSNNHLLYKKPFYLWDDDQFVFNEFWSQYGLSEESPVIWINLFMAERYALWLSVKTQKICRIPFESEWEKSARGVDARLFPWGDDEKSEESFNAYFLSDIGKKKINSSFSMQEFPLDQSCYGVRDLAGLVSDWTYFDSISAPSLCLNPLLEPHRSWTELDQCLVEAQQEHTPRTPIRGGSWMNQAEGCSIPYRFLAVSTRRYGDVGFRLVHP